MKYDEFTWSPKRCETCDSHWVLRSPASPSGPSFLFHWPSASSPSGAESARWRTEQSPKFVSFQTWSSFTKSFTDSSRSGYSWVSIIPSKSDLSKGKSLQQAMTSIFPVRPSYITFVCWCILISSKSSPIFEAHSKPRTGHHPSSVKPPTDKRIPYIQCLLVRGFIGWFVHGTCFFSCHCNV